MKPVWIDGNKLTSMVDIYMELGADTRSQATKKKIKDCLETGGIYNGHIVSMEDPSKVKPKKIERAKGDPLLPNLCTHHLGFNPDDRE